MQMNEDSIPTLNPKIVCRIENDESYTVYNPNTDVLTKLSPISKFILDLFDGQNTIGQVYFMLAEIHNEFYTHEGKKLFSNFLQKLIERGVLYDNEVKITTMEVKS